MVVRTWSSLALPPPVDICPRTADKLMCHPPLVTIWTFGALWWINPETLVAFATPSNEHNCQSHMCLLTFQHTASLALCDARCSIASDSLSKFIILLPRQRVGVSSCSSGCAGWWSSLLDHLAAMAVLAKVGSVWVWAIPSFPLGHWHFNTILLWLILFLVASLLYIKNVLTTESL